MNNSEIAKVLYGIAGFLEMQEIQFKPRAYSKAAQSLEGLPEDINKIYANEGLNGLKKIPGFGEHIALKVEELIKTGKLKYYENLKKDFPVNIEELITIPGLGPKE